MRRVSLSWLLSLLLVLAQNGALLHGLGHLAHASPAGGTATSELSAQADGPCGTCEAFAQVANPATGGAFELPRFVPPPGAVPAPRYSILVAETPTARSRGPPQI
jgi:hypothetical protein